MSRPLRAKALLREAGIPQAELCRHLRMSPTSVSLLLSDARWPADRQSTKERLLAFLHARGIRDARALERETPPRRRAAGSSVPTTDAIGDDTMVLRKQRINEKARKHFDLARDPFGECREAADLFLSPSIRYVREAMLDKVRHGGMLAVIGESGSGKSTLREELTEHVERSLPGTLLIQPWVVAMEDADGRGKPLRALHIAEAIMAAVAPLQGLKNSPEARFAQLHKALRDSSRTGNRHVIVIEEAHAIPVATLRHLKRFLEMKDGLRPLLAVILLGQPELATKLSEQNPEVREVVQRCEVVHLPPLDDHLGDYLRHRFARAGSDLARVLDASAIEAVRRTLSQSRSRGSLLYPLAVHNLVAGAINAAAELGAPRVTADLVQAS